MRFDTASAGCHRPLRPINSFPELARAYDYTHGYGVNDATYDQVNIGADYFLSKRTALYLVRLYQHASGTDWTGNAARAS